MKLLILGKIFSDKPQDLGIYQKCLGIQQGFQQLDIAAGLVTLTSEHLQLNKQKLKIIKHKPSNWYFINHYFDDVLHGLSINEYDAIWIRHHFYGPSIFKFIIGVKQINSKIKLLYELPTYPFLHELKGIKKLYATYAEGIYKNNFDKTIDRIITYSNHNKIYNTKTIQINNGINTSLYKRVANRSIDDEVSFVAMGKLWSWFGLDRILKGLINYNGKRSIQIDIIGDGVEMLNLKVFCTKNNLNNVVTFHGWQTKDQIDDIIANAHVGIGTLAIHRKKVALSSSLKHREYAARGLPFIYAGSDEDFDHCNFTYKLVEEDTIVDLDELIEWVSNIGISSKEIVSYAQDKLDWKVQLQGIVKYLQA